MTFQIHQSWITSLKAKNRDYPSGLEPDLKPRKAFIYLSYHTLTSQPLTSILRTQREIPRLFLNISINTINQLFSYAYNHFINSTI